MTKKDAIKIFEDKKIRAVWDDKKEEWFFSIVDVVAVLTDSDNPRRYWSDLKRKLSKKGSQLVRFLRTTEIVLDRQLITRRKRKP